MLDENIWFKLSEEDKIFELQAYLQALIKIEEGKHELSKTTQQGKLVELKKDLHLKINKIIELENAT